MTIATLGEMIRVMSNTGGGIRRIKFCMGHQTLVAVSNLHWIALITAANAFFLARLAP